MRYAPRPPQPFLSCLLVVLSLSSTSANVCVPSASSCTEVPAYTDLNQRATPTGRCQSQNLFDCLDGKTCVNLTKWRDGRCDCPVDCSDEWCQLGTVPCAKFKCVRPSAFGAENCTSVEDDKYCYFPNSISCRDGRGCVPNQSFLLNGRKDCLDGSDEDFAYANLFKTSGSGASDNSTSGGTGNFSTLGQTNTAAGKSVAIAVSTTPTSISNGNSSNGGGTGAIGSGGGSGSDTNGPGNGTFDPQLYPCFSGALPLALTKLGVGRTNIFSQLSQDAMVRVQHGICPCPNYKILDGSGNCVEPKKSGLVTIRVVQLCQKPVSLSTGTDLTYDKLIYSDLAAVLLSGISSGMSGPSTAPMTFDLCFPPNLSIKNGSLLVTLSTSCDTQDCSTVGLQNTFNKGNNPNSTTLVDVSSLQASGCSQNGVTNYCAATAICTPDKDSIGYSCACKTGAKDLSAPSRSGTKCLDAVTNANVAAAGISCGGQMEAFGTCMASSIVAIIVILLICAIMVLFCLLYFCYRRRKRKQQQNQPQRLLDRAEPTDQQNRFNTTDFSDAQAKTLGGGQSPHDDGHQANGVSSHAGQPDKNGTYADPRSSSASSGFLPLGPPSKVENIPVIEADQHEHKVKKKILSPMEQLLHNPDIQHKTIKNPDLSGSSGLPETSHKNRRNGGQPEDEDDVGLWKESLWWGK